MNWHFDHPYFVPASEGGWGGFPWWLSAQELWRMLFSGPPQYFASRPPIYPITPIATGETSEPIDPKSGLPQSIVDRLWQVEPPEGMPSEMLEPHPRFGLPKWMVSAAQGFAEQQGWDPDNLALFFQTLPWETVLAILAASGMPHFKVETTAPMPEEPQPPETPPPQPPKIPEPPQPPGEGHWEWNPEIGDWVFVPETPPKFVVDVRPPPEPPVVGQPGMDLPEPPVINPPLPPLPPVPPIPPPPPSTEPPDDQSGAGGGAAGGIPIAAPGATGPGAPYPGAPAPVVGVLRNLISQFLIPPYIGQSPAGLRRR